MLLTPVPDSDMLARLLAEASGEEALP
jgi:hypothetical protein